MPQSAWPSRRCSAVRDGEVALGRIRIDIDGGAADDAFHHLQPDIADRKRLVEEVEFVPGRPALDIEVGAEAKRMDRRAHHVLDGADAGEIDDGDDLAGDIRKTVAGLVRTFGGPLIRSGKVEVKKFSMAARP